MRNCVCLLIPVVLNRFHGRYSSTNWYRYAAVTRKIEATGWVRLVFAFSACRAQTKRSLATSFKNEEQYLLRMFWLACSLCLINIVTSLKIKKEKFNKDLFLKYWYFWYGRTVMNLWDASFFGHNYFMRTCNLIGPLVPTTGQGPSLFTHFYRYLLPLRVSTLSFHHRLGLPGCRLS